MMASQSSSMDNELLRDALNVIPEDDRGKLTSVCLECIQNNESMNFIEGVTLIASALPNVKVGILATIIKYMTTDDILFRDVLVDTSEGDREKLISVWCSSRWIPKEMNFIEALVFISILSKMGCLYMNNMDPNDIDIEVKYNDEGLVNGVEVNSYYSCTCTFDGDGRIVRLNFHHLKNGAFEVPSIVGRLQILTCIFSFRCMTLDRFLPMNFLIYHN
jgi:hypothetical protein